MSCLLGWPTNVTTVLKNVIVVTILKLSNPYVEIMDYILYWHLSVWKIIIRKRNIHNKEEVWKKTNSDKVITCFLSVV